MTSKQLEKLAFYSKEEALQFASLMEVGLHVCKEEVRYTVKAGKISYRVFKERFIKKYGYWQIV